MSLSETLNGAVHRLPLTLAN